LVLEADTEKGTEAIQAWRGRICRMFQIMQAQHEGMPEIPEYYHQDLEGRQMAFSRLYDGADVRGIQGMA